MRLSLTNWGLLFFMEGKFNLLSQKQSSLFYICLIQSVRKTQYRLTKKYKVYYLIELDDVFLLLEDH